MKSNERNAQELIRLANSLRRVVGWHGKRISELLSGLSLESDLCADHTAEFFELYIQGNSKEEIADILQVDPAIFDGLERWGKLEW